MKSTTSIVNTLLESGYADYDSNLDPFSDPKNITHDDLGHTYISREDMLSFCNWTHYLAKFGLIGESTVIARLPIDSLNTANSIDRVYIQSASDSECEAHLALLFLTASAENRITLALGKPDRMFRWPVNFVAATYK